MVDDEISWLLLELLMVNQQSKIWKTIQKLLKYKNRNQRQWISKGFQFGFHKTVLVIENYLWWISPMAVPLALKNKNMFVNKRHPNGSRLKTTNQSAFVMDVP